MATTADYRAVYAQQAQTLPTDSFLMHLVALLSVYEVGPSPAPLPQYNGPSDWQTEAILKSLNTVARRMYTAEETVSSFKASQNWQTVNGPDTKKRRSFGPIPPSETPSSLTHLTNGTSSGRSSGGGSTLSAISSGDDIDIASSQSFRTTGQEHFRSAARPPSPMKISLDGISSSADPESLFSNPNVYNPQSCTSAPPIAQADHACPTCGKTITDTMSMAQISALNGSTSGSPLVVPPGPLAAAAFESGMSAVEELRLLKAQVQDVARVCNAVASSDLSQKITVPVQGVVMVQLKDVINTMVRINFPSQFHSDNITVCLQVDKLGQFAKEVTRALRKSVRKGPLTFTHAIILQ